MSSRAIYESNRIEYLLPSASGAQVGDVLTLAAGNQLEFQAGGGGGGGLTQQQVYGAGAIYELPVLATAQNAQVMTVVSNQGQNTVQFQDPPAGGLTQGDVYGQGAIYELPVLATAAEGQIMTVATNQGQNSLVFSAQAQGLTQQQVYGQGNIYELPEIAGATNGQVFTVAGGALTFDNLPVALTAQNVWASGDIQYALPDITGVANGLAITATGTGDVAFTDLNTSALTQETVYGNGNPPYVIAPIASGNDGDVLTISGGGTAWAPPAAGVTEAEVWQNVAAKAKIPDYTGGPLPGAVMTLMNENTGETAWVQPPGVPASAVWANPAAPYTLPAIGTEGQVIAVSATPGTLEYVDPPSVATTTTSVAYNASFPTAVQSVPAYFQFSQTADAIVCTFTTDEIPTDGVTGGNLDLINFAPTAPVTDFMPNTSANPVELGLIRVTQINGTGAPSTMIGFLSLTPNNGNFTWTRYSGANGVTDSGYVAGSALGAQVQAGSWAIQAV